MFYQKKTCGSYFILLSFDTKSHIKYVSRSGKNERKRERKGEKGRSITFSLSVNVYMHIYACMCIFTERERASPVVTCHLSFVTRSLLHHFTTISYPLSLAKLSLTYYRKRQFVLWRVHCVLVINKMFDPTKTKAATQKKVQQKKVIKQLIEQCINIVPINLRVGEYRVGYLITIVDCIRSPLLCDGLPLEKWTTHL